jgi:hypothetical protein
MNTYVNIANNLPGFYFIINENLLTHLNTLPNFFKKNINLNCVTHSIFID